MVGECPIKLATFCCCDFGTASGTVSHPSVCHWQNLLSRHGVCVIFDDPPCDANLQEMVPRGPRSGDDSR